MSALSRFSLVCAVTVAYALSAPASAAPPKVTARVSQLQIVLIDLRSGDELPPTWAFLSGDSRYEAVVGGIDNGANDLVRYGEFLSSIEGREKEAEKFLRRAIALDPNYADAQNDLKALMERLGRLG